MNFADLFFMYAFLPLALIAYFIMPSMRLRNAVLIGFSLLFYAWGNPVMLVLLIVFTIVNYFLGIQIKRHSKRPAVSKTFLIIGLVLDIGLLFSFKYLGFFIENINSVFNTSISAPDMLLPIGLSFYTFRVISYLLDVYWEKVEAERNFSSFLLFTSLFPCTMAGPIVRYSTIGEELHLRHANLNDIYEGAVRFCIGLGKKVILADNLYTFVDHYWAGEIVGMSAFDTWVTVIVYSLYVYFDFSGYSDMAIGIGRIFGFHFEENFNYPFVCKSISEFWQRWHISLGSFFRDYLLYVPIFGRMRRYGGLFLVWFCTGLWHGASWNYVIWGLYFGLFILIETLLGKKRMKKIPVFIKHIYTKIVIIVGFGIFYFTDMARLGQFFKNLVGLGDGGFITDISTTFFSNNMYMIFAAILFTFPFVPFVKRKLGERGWAQPAIVTVTAIWCFALLIISSILLVDATDNPFLYQQF